MRAIIVSLVVLQAVIENRNAQKVTFGSEATNWTYQTFNLVEAMQIHDQNLPDLDSTGPVPEAPPEEKKPEEKKPEEKKGKIPVGPIAGGITAGIALLAGVNTILCVCIRRRRRKTHGHESIMSPDLTVEPGPADHIQPYTLMDSDNAPSAFLSKLKGLDVNRVESEDSTQRLGETEAEGADGRREPEDESETQPPAYSLYPIPDANEAAWTSHETHPPPDRYRSVLRSVGSEGRMDVA
ncbi:hypothetical protein PQX77_012103 [Marasmius sp. AFHP31]|nr:hypothetical protein PQX77_012103 [Marasmius sp. AFHP31]